MVKEQDAGLLLVSLFFFLLFFFVACYASPFAEHIEAFPATLDMV